MCKDTERALYDIFSVQDLSTVTIQKMGYDEGIFDMEGALQWLRADLEARDRASLATQETKDQWLREQFAVMVEVVRGLR